MPTLKKIRKISNNSIMCLMVLKNRSKSDPKTVDEDK